MIQPQPPYSDLFLFHRVVRFALDRGAPVWPCHYIHDLSHAAGQSQVAAVVPFDRGAGPFVVTAITLDGDAASGLAASTGGLVELEGNGRKLTDGQVSVGAVMGDTGAALDNPWQAAPAVVEDGGELIARLQYGSAKSVQNGESFTVYGFHTTTAAARAILACYGVPYNLRQVLTSTASLQRPQASRAMERPTALFRVLVEGESDDLDLEAGGHRIRRGDARTTVDQGPDVVGAIGEALFGLVIPRHAELRAMKRDTSARTTTVHWHGAQHVVVG